MLAACIESVRAQTDPDWEIVFVVDKEKQGIAWANRAMVQNAHRARGQWVYHLDDDTRLLDRRFVARVKAFVARNSRAEVVMVRSRREQMKEKEMPVKHWGGTPIPMRCNSLCHVTRADVWKRCIFAFGGGGGGSGRLVAQFLNVGAEIAWMEGQPVAETQQIGRGRKFETCKANWWEQTVKKYGIVEDDGWRLVP